MGRSLPLQLYYMSNKGTIGVTSENIFPVIKKFLYSEHDIFLRELISNAVDATTKLNALIARGTSVGNTENLRIEVLLNEKEKTLTIRDMGVGMSSDEIERYINQIAFSGAEDFLEKFKDASGNIIGHFGVGFYSAFMVAERVEIFTKSYREEAPAMHWECTGSPEYSMEETAERTERGTDIVLHLDADSLDYLKRDKVEEILRKYCRFLPVPIVLGKKQEWKDGKMQDTQEDNVINNTNPLWSLKPSDITDEQYKAFYRELYPMSDEPLFWIHLNVDYPFKLTGILYFPKIHSNVDLQKNKIRLYCNQVFVTDELEGVVPEYLTLLHGVIDSPDIPLNVSRSYLQGDPNVSKISSHITKKVADRLEELFKKERSTFEAKWTDLKLFVQYGMLSEEKFYDRALKFTLFTDTEGKNFTAEEYQSLIKAEQTDKDNRLVYLYTTDTQEQYSYIKAAQSKGYNVLVMDGILDTAFMNHMEQKWENSRFVRVDSDTLEALIPKDHNDSQEVPALTDSVVGALFTPFLPNDKTKHFTVQAKNLSPADPATLITRSEWTRRMKEMAKMQSGMAFYGELPDGYNLVVNLRHPLMESLLKQEQEQLESSLSDMRAQLDSLKNEVAALEEEDRKQHQEKAEEHDQNLHKTLEEKRSERDQVADEIGRKIQDWAKSNPLFKQITDLALLSAGLLQGEQLDSFIRRSVELLQKEA